MVHVVLERVVGIVLPPRRPQRKAAFDHSLAKTLRAAQLRTASVISNAMP